MDASLQSISGKNQTIGTLSGEINFIKNGNVEGSAKVELGTLLTDGEGRLIVVGGPGKSASPLVEVWIILQTMMVGTTESPMGR